MDETYRGTLTARPPDEAGQGTSTVIVTRQGLGHSARTWLTLAGSIRCTAVLTRDQVDELQQLLSAAKATKP